MKQFFISFFASLLAIVVSFFLVFIIIAGIVAAAVSGTDDDAVVKIKENSIMHIKLNALLPERSPKEPFEGFGNNDKKVIGLSEVLECLEQAEGDNNIKGIFLDLSSIPSGIASLEDIRSAMLDFKKSGKFIVAYSEYFSQKSYYLATVADKIYLNPQGGFDWHGLSSQIMFFKGMLDKLDIEMQVFRHGKFKSAVEPFVLDKMSDANRSQTEKFIGSIWDHMVLGISTQRKISVEELNKHADLLSIRNPEDAKKAKLVDDVKYYDEVLEELASKTNAKNVNKINFVSLGKYSESLSPEKRAKNKIAIIYAVGDIEGGEGDDETIGSDRIAKAVREARLDSAVKAIVLRVNSPGGSALASDVIWREVMLTKKTKPVVVSMGNVAASGGYYISCAADVIVAQPNTITGSIGVFGLIPNMKKLFNDKLGINIDTVNTNKHADYGTAFRAVDKNEAEVIQAEVENVYNTFIGRVAEGRRLAVAQVDSVGQGRVWSGVDAKNIGLVDELGGIEKAITIAAKKAKLLEYRTVELPHQKDFLDELMDELSGKAEAAIMVKNLGPEYELFMRVKKMAQQKGVQARLPFEMLIN